MESQGPSWLQVNWLKSLLAIAGVVISLATYLALTPDPTVEPSSSVKFLLEMLPNLAAVLVAYLFVSYVLERKGLATGQVLAETISRRVAAHLGPRDMQGLVGIYRGSITSYDWKQFFESAVEVDIVTRFFDGVLSTHRDEIVKMLANRGRIRLFIIDPRRGDAMEVAALQRTAYSEAPNPEDVRVRVLDTIKCLENAAAAAQADPEKVQIILLPYAPNYSAYYSRNRKLVLSAVEHCFRSGSRSPRVEIDVRESPHYRSFIESEIEGLIAMGMPAPSYETLKPAVRPPQSTE
jgi:hypothetical protein